MRAAVGDTDAAHGLRLVDGHSHSTRPSMHTCRMPADADIKQLLFAKCPVWQAGRLRIEMQFTSKRNINKYEI